MNAGPTRSCSSTVSPWPSSNSSTPPIRRPHSGRRYGQLQLYKEKIPSLLAFNELLIVSDGPEARMGTLTAGKEWFKRWRTVSGEEARRSRTIRIAGDA